MQTYERIRRTSEIFEIFLEKGHDLTDRRLLAHHFSGRSVPVKKEAVVSVEFNGFTSFLFIVQQRALKYNFISTFLNDKNFRKIDGQGKFLLLTSNRLLLLSNRNSKLRRFLSVLATNF